MKKREIYWAIVVTIALFNTVNSCYRMYSQASNHFKWHVILWACIVFLGLYDCFSRHRKTSNRRLTEKDRDGDKVAHMNKPQKDKNKK